MLDSQNVIPIRNGSFPSCAQQHVWRLLMLIPKCFHSYKGNKPYNHTTIHITNTMNQCGSFALLTTEWKVLKSLYVLSHQVHFCIHQASLDSSISHHTMKPHVMCCFMHFFFTQNLHVQYRSDVFSKCQPGWQTHVFSEDPWDKNLRCQKHLFVLAIGTALNGRLGVNDQAIHQQEFSVCLICDFPTKKHVHCDVG